jgi:hypothetical protein
MKRITRGLRPSIIKNAIGLDKIDQSLLKPRTKEFIQYRSNCERDVYYRFGIIDFL